VVDSPELVGTETCELLAESWQAGIDRKCTLWVSGCKGLGRRRSSILHLVQDSFLTTRGPSTTSEGILSDAWGVYMTRSVRLLFMIGRSKKAVRWPHTLSYFGRASYSSHASIL